MRLQYQSGWVQSLFTKQHPLPLWQDYTWFFQGIMPLMGYLGGIEVFGWIGTYAPWIVYIFLLLMGSRMIFESFSGNVKKSD